MEEGFLSPSPEIEDVERWPSDSDLTARVATLVGHANDLAWLGRRPYMRQTQFLVPAAAWVAPAAARVDEAATALSVSSVDGRTRAAGALLRACVKLSIAAQEASLEELVEAAREVVEEAAEVMRLASEYRRIRALQPQRGWRRRLWSWCVSSTSTPPRATSGELQVDPLGFALSGAISLLPYIGRDGVFKDSDAYNQDYLWWVSLLFSSVWATVAVSLHAQDGGGHWLLVEFGRFSRYAATLGVTLLVFFFCSWMLTPGSSTMLTVLCIVSGLVHLGLWIESMMSGRH